MGKFNTNGDKETCNRCGRKLGILSGKVEIDFDYYCRYCARKFPHFTCDICGEMVSSRPFTRGRIKYCSYCASRYVVLESNKSVYVPKHCCSCYASLSENLFPIHVTFPVTLEAENFRTTMEFPFCERCFSLDHRSTSVRLEKVIEGDPPLLVLKFSNPHFENAFRILNKIDVKPEGNKICEYCGAIISEGSICPNCNPNLSFTFPAQVRRHPNMVLLESQCKKEIRCKKCGKTFSFGGILSWHNENYCSPECGGIWWRMKDRAKAYPVSGEDWVRRAREWVDTGLYYLFELGVSAEYGELPLFDPSPEFFNQLSLQEQADWLSFHLGIPRIETVVMEMTVPGQFCGQFDKVPSEYRYQLFDQQIVQDPPGRDAVLQANIAIAKDYCNKESLGTILAHEFSHAYLYFKRIQGVYWDRGNEALTDLTSIVLGFGKLYLNGLLQPTGYLGYLPPPIYGYAYGKFCSMYGIGEELALCGLNEHALKVLGFEGEKRETIRNARRLEEQEATFAQRTKEFEVELDRIRREEILRIERMAEKDKFRKMMASFKSDAQWLYRYGNPGGAVERFTNLSRKDRQRLISMVFAKGDKETKDVIRWLIKQFGE